MKGKVTEFRRIGKKLNISLSRGVLKIKIEE